MKQPDYNYHQNKLELIIRDLRDHTADELARALMRLAMVSDSEVIKEKEFTSEMQQRIQELEKEKYESIEAWNSKLKLEKLTTENAELKNLQQKYVWVTREEMKEYSDIHQALRGQSLAQHDKEVKVDTAKEVLKHISRFDEYGELNDVIYIYAVEDYIKQLQEQD